MFFKNYICVLLLCQLYRKMKEKMVSNKKSTKKIKSTKKKDKNNKKDAPTRVSKRNKKPKNSYSPALLASAIKAVKDGISIRKAAFRFCVPQTTLFRRYRNPDKIWKKGAETILTRAEELEIIDWIKEKSERWFPTDKEELLDCVQMYIKASIRKKSFH